jgi:hypothetical protein
MTDTEFACAGAARRPAEPLDWADVLAADIIADFYGKPFTAARMAIADRLRGIPPRSDRRPHALEAYLSKVTAERLLTR